MPLGLISDHLDVPKSACHRLLQELVEQGYVRQATPQADYVMTMYGKPTDRDVSAGRKLYADNCAVCHGEAGQGDREKGHEAYLSRSPF